MNLLKELQLEKIIRTKTEAISYINIFKYLGGE